MALILKCRSDHTAAYVEWWLAQLIYYGILIPSV